MLRQFGRLVLAAAAGLALSGCVPGVLGWQLERLPLPSGSGAIDGGKPLAVTEAAAGPKEGRATARGVLGLVSWGDASTAAACRREGIARVCTVDVEGFSLLGIYCSYTTVVTGE